MPVIGSSSIIPSASLGPLGPTGATGVGITGARGPTGATGATGATGTYVASSYHDWPYLYLVLSDGTEIKVEGVAGVTGEVGDADGVNQGSGVGIFKEVTDGMTFWFKGISAEGSLLIYETDDTIGISGDRVYQEGLTADGISDKLRFAYLSTGNTADVSGLTFDPGLTGTIIFGHGPTGNRWSYDPEEIVVPVDEVEATETVTIYGGVCEGDCGQTAGNGVGIQLGITSGSVYSVQTPIGIAGFTGEFRDDETYRFTMLLHGNNLWDWPKNVYFDDTDVFFSCGTDIIGFSTSNKGETWYANLASRAYGVEECESVYGLGSCCFVNDDGIQDCQDYIPENVCSLKNSSFWNPLATCADNCGQQGSGICCSEGGDWNAGQKAICIEDSGPAECNYFNGRFWDYMYYEFGEDGELEELPEPIPLDCQGVTRNETPHSSICTDPCEDGCMACCKNGSCIGDLDGTTSVGPISEFACIYVYGGLPVYIDEDGRRSSRRDFGGGTDCENSPLSSCEQYPASCSTGYNSYWRMYQHFDTASGFDDFDGNVPDGTYAWELGTFETCQPVQSCSECVDEFDILSGILGPRLGCDTHMDADTCDGWINPTANGWLGACCLGPGSSCIETTRCDCEGQGGNWIQQRRCKSADAYHHGIAADYEEGDPYEWRDYTPGQCRHSINSAYEGGELLPDIDCSIGVCARARQENGEPCLDSYLDYYEENICCEESTPEECQQEKGGKRGSWQGYGSTCHRCNEGATDWINGGILFFQRGSCFNMSDPPPENPNINDPMRRNSSCVEVDSAYACIETFGGEYRPESSMERIAGVIIPPNNYYCPNDCNMQPPPPPPEDGETPGFNPDCASCGTVDCCDYIVHDGACCLPSNEECINTDNVSCRTQSGVFMGPGTNCESVNCCYDEFGWCCREEGNCEPTYEEECAGNWYTDRQECSDACVPYVTGACCIGETCQETSQEECSSSGGVYQGDDVSCVPNPCETEEPLGYCCDGEYCNYTTQSNCDSIGGTWYGQNIQQCNAECGPDGTCCYVIKTQNDADPVGVHLGCQEGVTRGRCNELSLEFPIAEGIGRFVFTPGVGPEYSCAEIGCIKYDLYTRACIRCEDASCGASCCCPDVGVQTACYDTGMVSSPLGQQLFDGLGIDIIDMESPQMRFWAALRQCANGPIDWDAWGLGDFIPKDEDGNYVLYLYIDSDECCHYVYNYYYDPPEEYFSFCCQVGGQAPCDIQEIFGYNCQCGYDDIQFGPYCPGDEEDSCANPTNCQGDSNVVCGEYDPCENVTCTGEESPLCVGSRRSMNNLVKLPDGRCVWMMDADNSGFPPC